MSLEAGDNALDTGSGSPAGAAAAALQLRVTYIWCDEVMADEAVPFGSEVILGTDGQATITIGDIGLPERFTILRPGARGYVLTLGRDMAGQMFLGGRETAVDEFLREERGERADGVAGVFRATSVGPGDAGIIHLDGAGDHVLAFQFVQPEGPLARDRLRDKELLLPALLFALILHTAFVVMTFTLHSPEHSLVFPGRTELVTSYLVARPEPPPPPEKGVSEPSASKDGEVERVKSATQGKKGKAGGEGKKPRQRDPEPGEVPPEIQTGLLSDESRDTIRRVTQNRAIDDRLKRSLSRLKGTRLADAGFGSGTGTGTGFGPGRDGTGTTRGGKGGGPGGGGSVQGDFVSQGKVDVGETRQPKGTGGGGRGAKEVAVVGTGNASGDFGGLSKAEIDRVVRSRQGLIRACYQRELNRSRGLGGKLVVSFRILATGAVQSARVDVGKSSLRNKSVESCVVRQIQRLKFPAKGGGVVNYPFVFSQG